MKTKICDKCKKRRKIQQFEKLDGKYFRKTCKICRKEYQTTHSRKTGYRSKYYQKNKKRIDSINKQWRLDNIEQIREYDRNYKRNPKNRPKINIAKRKYYNKRKKDPLYRLIYRVRNRTKKFFRDVQFMRKIDFPKYIGCSPNELFIHIEKQFKPGMNWNRFKKAEIHIDHIIPISKAKTEKDVYKLSHYTNLQPLWAKDNLKKSDN